MAALTDPTASWQDRAQSVIPGGASTGSKRPDALYGTAASPQLPTHSRRAWGCRLETADGATLVDCTMALGAVTLGYADAYVTEAVQAAAATGPASGLSPVQEVEIAERLVSVIPAAEQVRFLKSGAEATAAAVRLARACTGREAVIASGYFGWHDWSNDGPGVPETVRADVRTVPFNDLAALDRAVSEDGERLAAIVLEPMVHEVATPAWLRAARAHCDRLGAVLVFDEIKTAFRLHTGGVQALTGVTPDLTTLGKGLANGYPLAAVVGARSVMETARQAWISSTLASETTALAAAGAVLDRHRASDVCAELAAIGNQLQSAMQRGLSASSLPVRVEGPPSMFRLVAARAAWLDALVAETVAEGVLLKRGAYQFACLAHDEAALARVEQAVRVAGTRLMARGLASSEPIS